MIRKVIEISTGGTRLLLAHRQLVIERPELPDATVPCEDVGLLVVDHPQTTYTHRALTELVSAGAAIVVCGSDHQPAGLMLPIDAHTTQTEKHRAQAAASEPVRKQAWKQIVKAKLLQQGAVLASATGSDAGLSEMARRVRSGDPDNLEAQGAQRYWPRLLGSEFRRGRDGSAPNSLLNYGYAVLRAATARAIVAAGLIPTLGVHHRHRSNPFCLADDLMEPYRPFVDLRVRKIMDDGGDLLALDRPTKQALLSLFNEAVELDGRRSPILLALHSSATALARAFGDGNINLVFPRGLPIPDPGDDSDVSA